MAATYEKFSENGDLFIRTFLIDSETNSNDWQVSAASIPKNIESFVGMPFVLYEKFQDYFDHPIQGKTLAEIIQHQQRFAIGDIVKVVKNGSKWDAVIKITDEKAKEALLNHDIPFYVSPTIVHDPSEKDVHNIWAGLQLAVVSEPAYGLKKAQITGLCEGQTQQCMVALKAASQKEDCGFCVKTKLLSLIDKQKSDPSHSDTSLHASANNSISVMPEVKELESLARENDALKAELAAVKSASEESSKFVKEQLEGLKKQQEQFAQEKRAAEIRNTLSQAYEGEALNKQVDLFSKSNLSLEQIGSMHENLIAMKSAAKGVSNADKFASGTNTASASKTSDKWFVDFQAYQQRLLAE